MSQGGWRESISLPWDALAKLRGRWHRTQELPGLVSRLVIDVQVHLTHFTAQPADRCWLRQCLDVALGALKTVLASFGEVIAKVLVRFFFLKSVRTLSYLHFFFLRLRLKKMNWDCNILKMVGKHLRTVECQLYGNRNFGDFWMSNQNAESKYERLIRTSATGVMRSRFYFIKYHTWIV